MSNPAILALFVVALVLSVWVIGDASARLLRRTGFRPLRGSSRCASRPFGFNPSRGEI
jgi:hypothetical protein